MRYHPVPECVEAIITEVFSSILSLIRTEAVVAGFAVLEYQLFGILVDNLLIGLGVEED
jgi:hypothetical protein